MSFEVNTGTAASALDGTEKMPVSQGALPRVITTKRFPYYDGSTIRAEYNVRIDTGLASSSLYLGDPSGLTAFLNYNPGADLLSLNANSGSITDIAFGHNVLSWTGVTAVLGGTSTPATATFANSGGVRILDTDASHTLRLAVGSNLTANRTFTLTTPNANFTMDVSALTGLTFSIDGTLAGNSDAIVPTQKAVKTYVDGIVAANDAMVFKGVIDCSANPNYPAADRGHTYRVSVTGKIGGASGTDVEAGDILLCLTDGTAAGNQATVGSAWSIIQTNLILAANVATFLATPSSANLAAAVTDETGSGALVFGTSPTLATPVINGLPTGTGVSSTNAVSTLLSRDANGNTQANNFVEGFTTTATAAGTTTLTITATFTQIFTGSTTQTVKLPTTSVLQGQQYLIINQSSGAVTVQSSGANTIVILAAGTSALLTAVVAAPTTAANWSALYAGANAASGKVATISNTLTLAGTDNTTQTFPSTSATIARTDAAQTFSGTQTFSGLVDITNGQAKFPATQNASADANTLDDYEEGTFTPVLKFGGATTGITYGVQSGVYTKIGNLVFISLQISLSSKGSATGSATITGLPFTNGALQKALANMLVTLTLTGSFQTVVAASGTSIDMSQQISGTWSQITDAHFNNASVLVITGTYTI